MTPKNLKILDLFPTPEDFLGDVVKGLRSSPKAISPKYCYDAVGSDYFEAICKVQDYYLTRVELAIIDELGDIELPGAEKVAVVELGGASSYKFRCLLPHLKNVEMFVPVDISRDFLFADAKQLAEDKPGLNVLAICADYNQVMQVPWAEQLKGKTPLLFFPGSTIGNLNEADLAKLLASCRSIVGDDGYMLVGCDLVKDKEIVRRAYDDSEGANAKFNLNVLHRINRELAGDIKPETFEHDVQYNEAKNQIDIHLVSKIDQTIHIGQQSFDFKAGEGIFAESSRKFTKSDIEDLAKTHGFEWVTSWTDPEQYYAMVLLKAVP